MKWKLVVLKIVFVIILAFISSRGESEMGDFMERGGVITRGEKWGVFGWSQSTSN